MIATASRLNDVHIFQFRNDGWLLIGFQFRLSQLAELITTQAESLAIHVD